MATNSSVNVTSTSTEIVPANSGRQVLILQNTGGSDIYLSFGAAATTWNGMLLSNGSILTLSDEIDLELLTEGLNGITSSWTSTLLLIYK